jgi:hypothetical protein
MATRVGSDPLTAVVDFDGVCGGANLHQFFLQPVGDAVVVAFELHVVVNVDARFGPATEFEALLGKGFQGRSIQLRKQAGPTAGAFLEGSVVQFLE